MKTIVLAGAFCHTEKSTSTGHPCQYKYLARRHDGYYTFEEDTLGGTCPFECMLYSTEDC